MYKNYITGQTALTLNLGFTIPNNHLLVIVRRLDPRSCFAG